MRTLFSLLCWLSLAMFVVGVVSIIKPLKILRITNRRTGLFVVVGSFVALLFFANARLSPEDKARLATERQVEQQQEQAKAKPPEASHPSENKQPGNAASQAKPSGADDSALPETKTKQLSPAVKKAGEEAARIAFVKIFEEDWLDKGFDVDVTASGREHRTITLRSALAGKPLLYQIHKSGIQNTFVEMGFTKFVLTNGYDYTVTCARIPCSWR